MRNKVRNFISLTILAMGITACGTRDPLPYEVDASDDTVTQSSEILPSCNQIDIVTGNYTFHLKLGGIDEQAVMRMNLNQNNCFGITLNGGWTTGTNPSQAFAGTGTWFNQAHEPTRIDFTYANSFGSWLNTCTRLTTNPYTYSCITLLNQTNGAQAGPGNTFLKKTS